MSTVVYTSLMSSSDAGKLSRTQALGSSAGSALCRRPDGTPPLVGVPVKALPELEVLAVAVLDVDAETSRDVDDALVLVLEALGSVVVEALPNLEGRAVSRVWAASITIHARKKRNNRDTIGNSPHPASRQSSPCPAMRMCSPSMRHALVMYRSV